jgi:hypothetical protein
MCNKGISVLSIFLMRGSTQSLLSQIWAKTILFLKIAIWNVHILYNEMKSKTQKWRHLHTSEIELQMCCSGFTSHIIDH